MKCDHELFERSLMYIAFVYGVSHSRVHSTEAFFTCLLIKPLTINLILFLMKLYWTTDIGCASNYSIVEINLEMQNLDKYLTIP